MKVCIIGASGKLGRYMAQHALDRGYEVVGVCRKSIKVEGNVRLVVAIAERYTTGWSQVQALVGRLAATPDAQKSKLTAILGPPTRAS